MRGSCYTRTLLRCGAFFALLPHVPCFGEQCQRTVLSRPPCCRRAPRPPITARSPASRNCGLEDGPAEQGLGGISKAVKLGAVLQRDRLRQRRHPALAWRGRRARRRLAPLSHGCARRSAALKEQTREGAPLEWAAEETRKRRGLNSEWPHQQGPSERRRPSVDRRGSGSDERRRSGRRGAPQRRNRR